jgi:ubiquinone/menaquinone biosynthesis C-methylase UbiE
MESGSSQKAAGAPLKPDRIMQFAFAYSAPLMLEAAVNHRVFDVLDKGPKTLEEVAKETGASVRGLRGIMNALVGLELLARDGNRYKLTPESQQFLVSTKPGYFGAIFKHMCRQLMPKWMQLTEVVKTGKPATSINQEEGSKFFAEFVESIFPMSYPAAQTLGDALKISSAQTEVKVLDLAAGSGVWGIALAQRSPKVKVTAVDWPNVLDVTRRVVERFKLNNQFSYSPGDLDSADFGSGHHLATLGHILHSEGERRSRELLKKTFKALAPGGTIAIAEFTPNDERTGPPPTLIFAVNMLVNTDEGDTFTLAEVRSWLQEVGFKDVRTVDAPGPSPLILATKPA